MYENYIPSDDESVVDDTEGTLVPSHENSVLEDSDTFTEDSANEGMAGAGADDSGYCNDETVPDGDNARVAKDATIETQDKSEETKDIKDQSEQSGSNTKADFSANISADDEIFEDCVDDDENVNTVCEKVEDFDRVYENYTLEMKLALGVNKNA